VFRTFSLDAHEWWMLLALSAAIIPAMELFKLAQRAIGSGGASNA
jgi:hypothetical protein